MRSRRLSLLNMLETWFLTVPSVMKSAPTFLQPVIVALPLSYLNDTPRAIINNGAGRRAGRPRSAGGVDVRRAGDRSFRAFRWA